MLSFLKRIVGIGKKVFLVFLVYTIIIGLYLQFTSKNTLNSKQSIVKYNRAHMYKTINDPELNKTKQGKMSIKITRGVTCIAIGETCTNNPNDGDKYYSNSIMGFTGKLLAIPLTNPPASGVAWIQNSLENAGFIPKTYAAEGLGFATIKPFINLWKALRDVSYLALVLVIVAIGFMIMFRMKLNPQTVINIENSLPNIVVSLLFITFSFAIAGFLIDLMYLSIVIIISVIGRVSGGNIVEMTSSYLQAPPSDILGKVLGGHGVLGDIGNLFRIPTDLLKLPGLGFYTLIQAISTFFIGFIWVVPFLYNHFKDTLNAFIPDLNLSLLGNGVSWGILRAFFGAPVGIALAFLVGFAVSAIIFNLALALLILVTVIFVFYRILFMLLNAYIKVILLVVLAPLLLIFNAIPGKHVFSAWFANLFTELLSFPIIVTIFLLGSYISQIPMKNAQLLAPPFFADVNPETLSFLLGMGLLFMAPDLITLVKQLVLPKPLPLPNVGPGVFFGGASTGVGAGLGEVQKYAGLGFYFTPLGRLMSKIPGINVANPHGGGQPVK